MIRDQTGYSLKDEVVRAVRVLCTIQTLPLTSVWLTSEFTRKNTARLFTSKASRCKIKCAWNPSLFVSNHLSSSCYKSNMVSLKRQMVFWVLLWEGNQRDLICLTTTRSVLSILTSLAELNGSRKRHLPLALQTSMVSPGSTSDLTEKRKCQALTSTLKSQST